MINLKKQHFARAFALVVLMPSSMIVCAAEQYKLVVREPFAGIVDGRCDDAIKTLEKYLAKHPNDLESMYALAVAHARKGDIQTAVAFVRRAVDAGLPFTRFLAGPRDLLEPLTDSAEFKALAKEHRTELLHGPMLGCVTEASARFWVRTAHETPAQVIVAASEKMDSPIRSELVKTEREKDFTALLAVEGLKPDTRYYYELLLNGEREQGKRSFRTFPVRDRPAKFQVGFGGGAGYTPEYERMWNTVAAHNLRAFLLLGDNVYIDNPTRRAVQQYCYYRRQSRPEFRDFAASTCVYAIWDDHDFTTNDGRGGPEIRRPAWKIPVWHTFMNNWNNPYYAGGTEDQPGCWFDFSVADVDFFMLDCRYYRTNPRAKSPSMLGPAQKQWLFGKLKASKGTFRVLASSVPWAFGTKPGSLDTWEGYKTEREDIFSFIEANHIDGVILLSADRHRSDLWKIERPGGYPFYEFESSKLTNVHTHKLMPAALFGYNAKCSFGLLSFDTTLPDPRITYRIVNIDDEVVYTFSVTKSQLAAARP
jgi:alkaline phosphatase D